MTALDTAALRAVADRAFTYAGRTDEIAGLMRAALDSCRWTGPAAGACADHARRSIANVRNLSALLYDLGHATRAHAAALDDALAAAHAAHPGLVPGLCVLPSSDPDLQVLAAETC